MRHRFHSLCPYFAMFPEGFVEKHLIWSQPGDVVLDPFCGRGTTILEALLQHREAIGGDVNPVALCVSGAKADPPTYRSVRERVEELKASYRKHKSSVDGIPDAAFFQHCFHPYTLRQLVFLRGTLNWRRNRVDRFVSAMLLGSLHGESHRSALCLSNRMPRTISTKPDYSVRWWQARGCVAPKRDVFTVLQNIATLRYVSPLPPKRGRVVSVDARKIASRFPEYKRKVALMITSPPYLDTTNYREDQWLRLWFLGGPESPDSKRKFDDRHHAAWKYWEFLTESWAGVGPLLKDGAHIVIRIGGRQLDPKQVESQVQGSLRRGLSTRVRLKGKSSSRIVNGQVHAFRPGTSGARFEYDFHFQVS